MATKDASFAIRLRSDQIEWLDAEARRLDRSKAWVIGQLIDGAIGGRPTETGASPKDRVTADHAPAVRELQQVPLEDA